MLGETAAGDPLFSHSFACYNFLSRRSENLKAKRRARKMTQLVKDCASKPDDPSSIPGTYRVKARTYCSRFSTDFRMHGVSP